MFFTRHNNLVADSDARICDDHSCASRLNDTDTVAVFLLQIESLGTNFMAFISFVLLFWNSDEINFAAGSFSVCKCASRNKVTFYHIFHKDLFGDVFVFILSLFFFRWSAGLGDSELRYNRCTSIENDDAYFLIFALI